MNRTVNQSIAKHYLEDVIASFRAHRKLAEKALAQVKADEYFISLDAEANSIAVIMKHMAGNMLSRWTDFLTTDGEKADRNRDLEFVVAPETTTDDLRGYWDRGWQCLFKALEPLQPTDLEKRILIRGEEHTIVQAINRQLTHYAYHIGQIAYLAKHFRSAEWQSLSVPRNRSAEFNQYMGGKPHNSADTEHRFDAASAFARGSEGREK